MAIAGSINLAPFHLGKIVQFIRRSVTRRFHLRAPDTEISYSSFLTDNI